MAEKTTEHKQIVRILETDITGEKQILMALTRITGVGFSLSNAVCNVLNIDKAKQIGDLTDQELKSIENLIRKPDQLPKWMYNRRKDFDTGADQHLLNVDLKIAKENDIKRMKKIKSYKGIRHAMGQPVRGQRTRSHFRKGRTLGVKKTKVGSK